MRTGATTSFVGVELPKMHQGEHQPAEEYDAHVDIVRERIRDLKKLPMAEKEVGLATLANEITEANTCQNKA